MRKTLISLSIIGLAASALAAVPSGYYDSLEGLSGSELKKAAKKVAQKNHSAIDYGTSTWNVFMISDTRTINGVLYWWDMYSDNNVPAPNAGSHGSMNIEHSVANSWWGGTKNNAYKDLFHLNPSDSEANNRKSNYPLGTVKTVTWSNAGGITTVGKPDSGIGGGSTYVYEPADEYKGDFARAFFYMFTTYDDLSWKSNTNWMYDTSSSLTLKRWAYEMLLEWAENDPVSQKEIDRNEVICRYQGNRNPFIDCPDLARHIWGDLQNVPFSYDGTYEPKPEPDPDPTPDPDPKPNPTPGEVFELIEDFSIAGIGFPEGSSNRPSSEKYYTSSKTGIRYAIMGCYQNTFETPFYLLVNGKNNAGAYLSFSLDYDCNSIVMTTTGSCSVNASSAVNVYADSHLIGNYKVNAHNTDFTVEIPEQYRKPGTLYKIESATSSYNQQFATLKYECVKQSGSNSYIPETVLEEEDGPVSVFTLNGILVMKAASASELDNLPSGYYIVVTPGKSHKICL